MKKLIFSLLAVFLLATSPNIENNAQAYGESTIADAYKTRGKVYLELGEANLADADFKRSIELDPRLVFYKYFSSYASLDAMRNAGLFGMIGIAFVLVFGYKIKPPKKNE